MSNQVEGFWTFNRFRVASLIAALLLFCIGMRFRFAYDLPMPPLPPRPTVSAQALRSLDYSQNLYRALLETDARDFGIAPPGNELEQPFEHLVVEPNRAIVAGGPPLETRDLRLSARVERVAARLPTGTFVSDHVVVRIENRTDHAVAYRVDTQLGVDSRLCQDKGDLLHNAVALAPRGVAERTEFMTRNGTVTSATVTRVETLAIPPLSFYYVSRLFPGHIGMDPRTTRGHTAPKGPICADIPDQAIHRALEKGEATWRDVIDFYARESCEKYIFPVGYRAFTRTSEQPLPVPPRGPSPSP